MTRAARAPEIACGSRKQTLYRLNRPLGTVKQAGASRRVSSRETIFARARVVRLLYYPKKNKGMLVVYGRVTVGCLIIVLHGARLLEGRQQKNRILPLFLSYEHIDRFKININWPMIKLTTKIAERKFSKLGNFEPAICKISKSSNTIRIFSCFLFATNCISCVQNCDGQFTFSPEFEVHNV